MTDQMKISDRCRKWIEDEIEVMHAVGSSQNAEHLKMLLVAYDHNQKANPPSNMKTVERARLLAANYLRKTSMAPNYVPLIERGDYDKHFSVQLSLAALEAAHTDFRNEQDEGWRIIQCFREREGSSIQIIHDNPDFNSLPNCAICVRTNFDIEGGKLYRGDTILDCLKQAYSIEFSHSNDESV